MVIGAVLPVRSLRSFIILLVAYILWLALSSWVDYRLNPTFRRDRDIGRSDASLSAPECCYACIVAIVLMFSWAQMELDIAPLLASAGVLGLAIVFGAQKRVQDVINGVFIQTETRSTWAM